MEASLHFKDLQPTGMAGVHESNRTPHPLRNEEGVLYADYELPSYGDEVIPESLIEGKPQKQDEFGTTYPMQVQMNDRKGTKYNLLRCEAANPVSDIWVVKDTAWTTQPQGLNTDVARKLMSIGFNVLIKGPEIGSAIRLSHSAENTHGVLDYMEDAGYLDASHFAVEGYSRGSMIGFGTIAHAARRGRKPVYANLTDPCVALPVKLFDRPTTKKTVGLPKDLALLGLDIAHGLMSRRGAHLLNTVDFSPAGLRQIWRTGGGLMNGEAGMMAARVPEDTTATVAFFGSCGVNDQEIYREILDKKPNVRIVNPEGGHGKGIDTKIIGNIALRFGRVAEQQREGRSPREFDNRYITHGVRSAT